MFGNFRGEKNETREPWEKKLNYLRETGDFMALRVSVMMCLKLSKQ